MINQGDQETHKPLEDITNLDESESEEEDCLSPEFAKAQEIMGGSDNRLV